MVKTLKQSEDPQELGHMWGDLTKEDRWDALHAYFDSLSGRDGKSVEETHVVGKGSEVVNK